MPQITESSLTDSSISQSLLNQGLHGGFLAEEELSKEEIKFSRETEWVQSVRKFKCNICGGWHTTPPGEERCLQTQEPIEPRDSKNGFRVIADSRIDLGIDTGYTLFIKESQSAVNTSELPYKSIVFIPIIDEIVFPDRAGSTIFLPLTALAEFTETEARETLINEINEKRKRLVDWDRLDDNGGDFEEIVFRLLSRDEDYFNESWGGSGPDQGKDGFCSINLGGRETRVMVQAKFNNDGKSINGDQVEKSCRKAKRHDCGGLIIAAVKTSGDLESEFEQGVFRTKSVNFFRVWSGPVIKEKLAEHPDLIAEMFLE